MVARGGHGGGHGGGAALPFTSSVLQGWARLKPKQASHTGGRGHVPSAVFPVPSADVSEAKKLGPETEFGCDILGSQL